MIVKAAPLFATILCRWFGRFAIPMGDALSAVGGAIVGMRLERGGDQWRTELLIQSRAIGLQQMKRLFRRSSERW